MPLAKVWLMVSVCEELLAVSLLAQAICVNPVHAAVEDSNCKYKFRSTESALIFTFNGPPVTVKVYHLS